MSFTGFQLGLSDDLLEASRKVIEGSAEYKKFFDATLKKFGVTSPDELSNEKKKEFFNHIDKNYKAKDEESTDEMMNASYNKKKMKKEYGSVMSNKKKEKEKLHGMKEEADEVDAPTPTPENEEEAEDLIVQEEQE